MGVPTFYTRLLDHPGLTREACGHMRLFVSGSAPLLAETHAAWRERTGHAILERYGMTETNMITSNPYDGERRAGTVGFPLPGVSVRIAEAESGAPVAGRRDRRHRGQGAERLQGLLADAGEDRAGVPPRRLLHHRRPRAQVDADGYIHIVGRAKDLVISGGFNVYPKEVETEIDAIDGRARKRGDRPAASRFRRGRDGGRRAACRGATMTEEGVLAALEGRLAKFKAPKRVFFVDALPRNSMGKVQKALLRETYKDTYG